MKRGKESPLRNGSSLGSVTDTSVHSAPSVSTAPPTPVAAPPISLSNQIFRNHLLSSLPSSGASLQPYLFDQLRQISSNSRIRSNPRIWSVAEEIENSRETHSDWLPCSRIFWNILESSIFENCINNTLNNLRITVS